MRCGIAYGLDGDAETSRLCDTARILVSGRENASCDPILANLEERLNRLGELKPVLKVPCE